MAKKKYKVKPKKKSKSGTGRSVGSEEYSVLGALNEDRYRSPMELMSTAKEVMVTADRRFDSKDTGEYEAPKEVKKAVKKVRKIKVK